MGVFWSGVVVRGRSDLWSLHDVIIARVVDLFVERLSRGFRESFPLPGRRNGKILEVV